MVFAAATFGIGLVHDENIVLLTRVTEPLPHLHLAN